MKKIVILTCAFLMLASIRAQEVQQILVYRYYPYSRYSNDLSVSDTGYLSKFSVPNTSTGVLINGIRWATCNVDAPGSFASAPQSSGMFYQWNRAVGWSTTEPLVNHEGGTEWDKTIPTGDCWDEVNNKVCPAGWRLPTLEEQQSLLSSGSLWGEFNGVGGCFFGTRCSERLFFPAVGYCAGCIYYSGGYFCNYWSGTAKGSDGAYYIYLDAGNTRCESQYRNMGFSVRCVAE
jgi:uncharacterized protein (TIGR02145 family)